MLRMGPPGPGCLITRPALGVPRGAFAPSYGCPGGHRATESERAAEWPGRPRRSQRWLTATHCAASSSASRPFDGPWVRRPKVWSGGKVWGAGTRRCVSVWPPSYGVRDTFRDTVYLRASEDRETTATKSDAVPAPVRSARQKPPGSRRLPHLASARSSTRDARVVRLFAFLKTGALFGSCCQSTIGPKRECFSRIAPADSPCFPPPSWRTMPMHGLALPAGATLPRLPSMRGDGRRFVDGSSQSTALW